MGGSVGLLVPYLFVTALYEGVARAPLERRQKDRYRVVIACLVVAWTLAVWVSSLAGFVSFHRGDPFPRVVLYLGTPVLIGIVSLARSRTFTNHPRQHAGRETRRRPSVPLRGSRFSADRASRSLGGAGARAAFWAFTLSGLLDLLNVAYLILAYYPIWFHGTPSSAPMSDFALVMIPTIAAPFALLLHAYAIRGVVLEGGHHGKGREPDGLAARALL
jgi:hypothetical protein